MTDSPSPEAPKFFAGRMLLAMPGIGDDRFDHATIALCTHDEDGALGIDLANPIEGFGLRRLLDNFEIEANDVPDVPVLRGGPVDPHRGFVLHSDDWGGREMVHVADGWALSGSLDVLRAIGGGGGPSRYVVALGYAGWTAGQLESEMARHGWFLGGAIEGGMLSAAPQDRWTRAFADCGVDARLLCGRSGSA